MSKSGVLSFVADSPVDIVIWANEICIIMISKQFGKVCPIGLLEEDHIAQSSPDQVDSMWNTVRQWKDHNGREAFI